MRSPYKVTITVPLKVSAGALEDVPDLARLELLDLLHQSDYDLHGIVEEADGTRRTLRIRNVHGSRGWSLSLIEDDTP